MSERTHYEKYNAEEMRNIREEFHQRMGKAAYLHEKGESYDAFVELYEACKDYSSKMNELSQMHFE